MNARIVGRERERALLGRALASPESELVAVSGRRRVGKTYLVREVLKEDICFELTGAFNASLREQLANFDAAMRQSWDGYNGQAADWRDAFEKLGDALRRSRRGARKRVVFIDELPWLAARRSRFLPAFEHFWNAFAVKQRDLVVVVSGSAAAWMARELLHARGGLHNRVTRQVRLLPFTVAETHQYLGSRGIDLGHYQTLELYAAIGGIPHYLRHVERGESAAAAIDRLCLARDGELRDEFHKLYASLFEHSERHVAIVRALGKARAGLTRNEIVAATGLPSGGTVTKTLEDLEESGFLSRMPSLGHTLRDAVYRIGDEYSLFYLTWIEPHKGNASNIWINKRGTPAWRAWSGTVFEGMCQKHVTCIKRALGIEAVETVESAWQHRAARKDGSEQRGAQIDLVIDRKDMTTNLCEMKFAEGTFTIDKRYAEDLRKKRDVFRAATGTRKALLLTMVTTHGITPNAYASELVDRSITMDALFA